MSKEQLELIDLIVKERKEIEFLKEQLKQVEYDYHKNLVSLYDSVNILDKEETIEKENCKILHINKHRKIIRGILTDD